MMQWRKSRKKQKKEKAEAAERNRVCQEIQKHAEELAGEMNLRLLPEQDFAEKILFVERIIITQIHYPAEQKKRGFLQRIYEYICGFFKNLYHFR